MQTASPVLVSWSGGKDSCVALYEIQKTRPVEALLTTITSDFDRISMHGVRRILLERQAESLGLKLHPIAISKDATNEEYEANMGAVFAQYHARGIDEVVFGDLFLADIRAYRDALLARHHMSGIYPVWGRDTAEFVRAFLASGFQCAVVCVDPKKLDRRFAGRIVDEQFLAELPPAVDPCGENGEYHTFVFDGPSFRRPIEFTSGDIVLRDGFWFADLHPR